MDDLIKKVIQMRSAQKQYFKTRTLLDLAKAKSMEIEVDQLLKEANFGQTQQQELF